MVVYHIRAIPAASLLYAEGSISTEYIRKLFQSSLMQLCTLSAKDNSFVQIIFHSDSAKALHIYLLYSGQNNVPAKNIAAQLRSNDYTIEELSPEETSALFTFLARALNVDTAVVMKSEKLLTSSLSATGYYYFSDIFECGKMGQTNNYSLMLNDLQLSSNTFLTFQLIPTMLMQQESYAISDMSSSLEQTFKGLNIYGQFYREPFAEPAMNTFRYYAARIGQPLFLFSIAVASESGAAVSLASDIVSVLQTQNASPISLDIFAITEKEYLAQVPGQLPVRLNTILQQNYRNIGIWNSLAVKPINLFRQPFFVTAEEASCFFRLPINDGIITGIQTNRIAHSREIISRVVMDENNISFGVIKGSEKRIGIPLKALTQHALIVGMPGTGKTTFAIDLLLQLHQKGIPFLAIEPTKVEYRAMIDAIPELQIFTPGNNNVSPFIINPFIPPHGISVEQFIPSLASAFNSAFSMPQPLDMIFLSAIRKCYTEYNWKSSSRSGDPDVLPFGLYEFILVFKRLVDSMEYSHEVRSNIQSGGTLRLMNLIEQNSNIYDTVHSVPLEDLLQKPTILELNAINNTEYKSLIIALLLINICLYTKQVQIGDGELKNVLLIDEAHVLLGATPQLTGSDRADASGATIKAIQDMIAEIRSYGTGIVIADQSPSKVSNEIIANTDVKISFRLVSMKERELMANSTSMNNTEMQYLSRLDVGEAFISYRLLDSPLLVCTRDIRAEANIRLHVSNSEISERMNYWDDHQSLLKPYYECNFSNVCTSECDFCVREQAEHYASRIFETFSNKIKDAETLAKYLYRLHELVNHYEQEANRQTASIQLCNCTKIRFLRKIMLGTQLRVSNNNREKLLRMCLSKEES